MFLELLLLGARIVVNPYRVGVTAGVVFSADTGSRQTYCIGAASDFILIRPEHDRIPRPETHGYSRLDVVASPEFSHC